jgi:hypothetical protein
MADASALAVAGGALVSASGQAHDAYAQWSALMTGLVTQNGRDARESDRALVRVQKGGLRAHIDLVSMWAGTERDHADRLQESRLAACTIDHPASQSSRSLPVTRRARIPR